MFRRLLIAAALAVAVAASARAETTQITIGVEHNMSAFLVTPDGPGPYPAILVLHTSSGLAPADLEFANRLAQQGYVSLVPSFMAAYGITPQGRAATFTTYGDRIYADFMSALDMLRASDKVKGSKVGAVGFSNGGYFAAWLAVTAKVDAAVSYYGAYSAAGADRGLARFQSVARPGGSPLLIFHGGNDSTVPITAAEHLTAILSAAHTPFEYQRYTSAGHSFDRSGQNSDAAADAWARTLAFFASHLKQP
jgi:carboxymethylenebutenolidase